MQPPMHPAAPHPARPAPLAWLLGRDRAMRQRTAAVLLCLLLYLLCAAVAQEAVHGGVMRPGLAGWIVALAVPAHAGFYAAVRSGWSRRLRDPSLMLAQNAFALVLIACAYTQARPVDRGLVLMLLALVVAFGMYTHTPRQAVGVAASAVALLGAAMLVLTRVDPAYYPARLELLRFELLVGALPAMALGARQIAVWRQRAQAQRHELRAALDRARHLATHDALTGLLNRRQMLALLEQERRRVAAGGAQPFAVALLDIDHFKALNDRLGHRAGDEALCTFARTAADVLRRTPPDTTGRDPDLLARWGGEEFLILLPGADARTALAPLERLRGRLRHTPAVRADRALRLAFSAGVVQDDGRMDLAALLDQADRALYRAKAAGRDRTVCAAGCGAGGDAGPGTECEAGCDAGCGAGCAVQRDPAGPEGAADPAEPTPACPPAPRSLH
ncbi:MAG: GGDEF domain-containing protein [Burkholderiales bacterium]|nr:GGDEF domain-containing protein [Burkholderiales bacterium]